MEELGPADTWTTDCQHSAGPEIQFAQWPLEVLQPNMSQCHPKCSEGQKIPEKKTSLPASATAASDWPITMLSCVCVCVTSDLLVGCQRRQVLQNEALLHDRAQRRQAVVREGWGGARLRQGVGGVS